MDRARRTAGRAATSVVVLSAVLGLAALPASALSQTSAASPALAATSGSYQAAMGLLATATPAKAALVITVPSNARNSSFYVKAVNVGTLALNGANYTKTSTGGNATTELQSCSGVWNGATNPGTCNGAITVINTASTTTPDAYIPTATTATGKQLRLLVTSNAAITPVTLGVQLTRAHVRPLTTTSS